MAYPSSFNMADYVLTAGRAVPDKIALQVIGAEPYSLTYAALEGAVRGVATGLLRHARPGDRVLLRLSNSPLFPICYLAAIAAGLIPVPTSPQLTTPEVDKIAEIIDPAIALISDGVAGPTTCPMRLEPDDIAAMQTLPPVDFDMGDANRPAYIVFTSGTSGTPRAVVHAHRAVLARRMMFDGWYGLTPDDRLLHAGAFNWTYTMGTGLIDPWTMGATSLIPAPAVAPAGLAALLGKHEVSIFAAAPGVYRKMLKYRMNKLPTLRHGLSAGEKLPDVTRDHWATTTGTQIFEAYGMSECSTFISAAPARPAPPGTLGFAQTGRQIKLQHDGMIAIHKSDPGLMLGYYNAPDATAAKYAGDWFLTGDIGSITPQGAIKYEGRADDMMNAGGLRVSPVEVEDALHKVAPTYEWACAAVQLKPDVSVIAAFHTGPDMIEETQIKAALKPHLAAYKIPRLFVAVDALPRGANNKLSRAALRRSWEADHGQA